MAFNKHLLALAKRLFHQVGDLSTAFSPVEDCHINKDGIILPLARSSVFAAIVHRKTEIGHLSPRSEYAYLRISCQSSNQHHLVQVRHGSLLLSVVEGICCVSF